MEATAMPSPQLPQDLAGWLMYFSDAEMPILRQTARRLDEVRRHVDQVTGRDLTEIVLLDPLLAVRVLAFIQSFSSRHLRRDITTIAGAVMMLGVEPFFRQFDPVALDAREPDFQRVPLRLDGLDMNGFARRLGPAWIEGSGQGG